MVFVCLSSLILDSGLQLGRWTEWQGAPGPLTQWASGPELDQCKAAAHLMSVLLGWTGMWQTRTVMMVLGGS